MRLIGPILYVEDVKKSLSFYETSFDFKRQFMHESGFYAELNAGDRYLAFAAHQLAKTNFSLPYQSSRQAETPPGFELAFECECPEKIYIKALENGAVSVSPPSQKPWGQNVAYLRDLDGFLIAIGTPME
tara:strand:- start:1241 stop:1630 length:390 start_codon:yes stop_codon:yes gene_type:complete